MKFTSAFVVSMLLASSTTVSAMNLGDEEPVVSPEAEKVSVLQTVISPTRTTFYDKKNKLWRRSQFVQRDENNNMQVADDEPVVSPEAEKVSVLQTVISPTRTTFYNKKANTQKQAIAQIGDEEPVVSPEAEKVSVLQTVISPTRTTFYDKRKAPMQSIAQVDAQVDAEAEKFSSQFKQVDLNKRFKNQPIFEGNLYNTNNPMSTNNFMNSPPMPTSKPFDAPKPIPQVAPDAKKDIANKEVRPDVYQTVFKMVDPVPERRK